jgi:hypothetical protein
MPLAGVLRLANALDENHDQRISSVELRRRNGALTLYAKGLTYSISLFGERLAQACYLLESCIKMPIMIKPLRAPRKPTSQPSASLS